ncbi:uncharacterized protein LOC111264239 isoform X1 [Varroa jacobsoni]|uniref:uncharacterized protein LOC111264239 isoform X1 n=1 Tax=Varroa jacobsoni TaxID=62625 RepID=UPI000BF7415C|nr:uncharacterized protein LOC111264239 isoform X1 [Varroa jacobsoni]XP_022695695.1 uncharacterized protein LOC111264239 isoform X1 [Varroa jacobsoni]
MLISTASTADICDAWEKIGQGVAEDVGSKEIEGRFVPRSIGPSRMLTLNAQIQRTYILAGISKLLQKEGHLPMRDAMAFHHETYEASLSRSTMSLMRHVQATSVDVGGLFSLLML